MSKFLSEVVGLEISQIETAWDGAASGTLIDQLGYKPDDSKAYMQFSIQHSLPSIAGPTMKGNYLGYHPDVIERSYHGLRHQQLNLEHRIKRYNPEKIPRDRIIGAIVAVKFPPRPPMGWKIGDDSNSAPAITAVATIFKKAEGVPKVIGEHQGSKETWSNSIEVLYRLDDLGVYIPSSREIIVPDSESSLDEKLAARGMKGSVLREKKTGHLLAGKHHGEQLAILPGGVDGTIAYDGVGMTKTPAEVEAEIEQILASRNDVQGDVCSIPEELHMVTMIRNIQFRTPSGRRVIARVKEVCVTGSIKAGAQRMEGSPSDPVLLCRAEGHEFLRHLSTVQVV